MRDKGYDFIRFIATISIILWHFFTTCKEMSLYFPNIISKIIIKNSIDIGGVGVGLFFILSGALMHHLYIDKINIKEFYKKRFLRICIPQWIAFIAAFSIIYTINQSIIKSNKIGILISFLGLNYCDIPWKYIGINTLWIIGEWFTAVIIIQYAIFPILRKIYQNQKLFGTIFISLIFLLNLKYKILSNERGWFSLTNGLMYFWIGMLFDNYKYLINKKVIVGSIILITYVYLFKSVSIFGNHYLSVFAFSILAFIILYNIKFENKIIKIVCKYNYEIYLTHHRIFILLIPIFLRFDSNKIQFVIVFLFIIYLVYLISKSLNEFSNYIVNKFNKNTN